MRKKSVIFLILVCVLIAAVLTACSQENSTDTQEVERTVVSIAVDTDSSTLEGYAGEFDLSLVKLLVYYSDDTIESINLYSGLVDVNDRTKLAKVGTYQIKVNYEKCTTKFTVKLAQKPIATYTLRVYNGVPIKINDIEIEDEIAIEGEYYENTYIEGTEVTIEWIAEAGYYFHHWTDNDALIDSTSITTVKMNANHTYRAFSETIVNTVSFETNCNEGVESRRAGVLLETEIPELTKDGYVFDGWTTTPLTGNDAIETSSSVEKITFPYVINSDTILYGTWRRLGIEYDSYYNDKTGKDGYIVLDYVKNDKVLNIPARHNNKDVIAIGKDALNNASALEKLTIPATVEVIESGFVRNCARLKEIDVDISSRYFSDDNGVLYNDTGEELVAYPSGLLSAEYIVDGVKVIDDYAFYNALIGGIVLSNGLRTVGDYAFNSVHLDYVNFAAVNPNESGFSLGDDLFDDNLSHILITSYRDSFLSYSSISSNENKITVDEGDLATIGINSEKTFIYKNIFNENSDSTTYTKEIIGADRSQVSVVLPNSIEGFAVSSIGYKAFNGCIYLREFTIPIESKLERILDGALDGTPYVEGLLKQNKTIIANGILYKYLGNESDYSLANSIKKIAEGAFSNNQDITCLTINGNSLSEIAAYAFYNCKNFIGAKDKDAVNVTGLTLKSMTSVIGNYAFYGTAIRAVSGSGVRTIGKHAFERCYNLLTVDFGRYVSDIASDAFLYCYSLQSYIVNEENNNYHSYGGVLYSKSESDLLYFDVLYLYPSGKMAGEFNVGLPFGVASLDVVAISDFALFYANIASLYIPNTVLTISSSSIYIPGLISLRFKSIQQGITYNDMFVKDDYNIGKWAPEYITVEDYNKEGANASIDTYFGNDATLRAAMYRENASSTFVEENNLILRVNFFNDNPDSASVVRSARNVATVTIPDTISVFSASIPVNTIDPYAFVGYAINRINLGSNIQTIASHALSEAYVLKKLYTDTNKPDASDDSFGPTFNNGLFIYILPDRKSAFEEDWNARAEYLIDNSAGHGYPVVTFSYRTDAEAAQEFEPTSGDSGVILGGTFPVPSRAGYDFGGWVDDNENVIDIEEDYEIPYNITLICVWVAKQYTIIFNIGTDATMSSTTRTISYNDNYNFERPVYNNHSQELSHWRTINDDVIDPDGTWTYLGESVVNLYAVWVDVVYTITYDTEGGLVTVADPSTSVKYNDNYTLVVPTKVGYIFTAWALEDGTLITDSNGTALLRWQYTESHTVTARWNVMEDIVVNLYFDDSVLFKSYTIRYSSSFSFPYENVEDESWAARSSKFCGWFDSYDSVTGTGTGRRFTDDEGNGLFAWDVGEDIDLYAQWPLEVSTALELESLTAAQMSRAIFLNSDVTLTAPIGSASVPFTGLFNGNGHTVTFNYNSSSDAEFDGYVGLFAYNKGIIKNVKVDANITVTGTDTLNNGVLCVGVIAGLNEGTIYSTGLPNADVNATINVKVTSAHISHAHIGGLIGYNRGGSLTGVGIELNPLVINVDNAPYTDSDASLVSCGIIVGTENNGSYASGNRSFSYYYNDEDDPFKNYVKCGNNETSTAIDIGLEVSSI